MCEALTHCHYTPSSCFKVHLAFSVTSYVTATALTILTILHHHPLLLPATGFALSGSVFLIFAILSVKQAAPKHGSQLIKQREMPDLSDEVLLTIFSKLDNQSLATTSMVCKKWRDIAHDRTLIPQKVRTLALMYIQKNKENLKSRACSYLATWEGCQKNFERMEALFVEMLRSSDHEELFLAYADKYILQLLMNKKQEAETTFTNLMQVAEKRDPYYCCKAWELKFRFYLDSGDVEQAESILIQMEVEAGKMQTNSSAIHDMIYTILSQGYLELFSYFHEKQNEEQALVYLEKAWKRWPFLNVDSSSEIMWAKHVVFKFLIYRPEWLNKALKPSRSVNWKCFLHAYWSLQCARIGKVDEAREHLNFALNHKDHLNRVKKIELYKLLAEIYFLINEPIHSKIYIEFMLNVNVDAERFPLSDIQTCLNAFELYNLLGLETEKRQYLNTSLEFASKLDTIHGYLKIFKALESAQVSKEQQVEVLEKAHSAAEKFTNFENKAYALCRLAALMNQFDHERAKFIFSEAHKMLYKASQEYVVSHLEIVNTLLTLFPISENFKKQLNILEQFHTTHSLAPSAFAENKPI